MFDISVILPTYKPGEYIYECISSLCSQDILKSKYEILIILNGCKNPWYDKINAYTAQFDNNIRIIQIDQPGVSNARNVGIKESRGKYITFIDDDDYISQSYLSSLLKLGSNETIVLSNIIAFYDKSNKPIEDYYMSQKYRKLLKRPEISLFSARNFFNVPYMKLIPKKIISNVTFNENFHNGEDSLFMFEMSKYVKNIVICDCQAIYYRRYRENSAVTKARSKIEIILNAIKLSYAFFRIWIKDIDKYNFIYALSRIIAPIKSIYDDITFLKSFT